MLLSYARSAVRTLKKNTTASVINVVGLSIALAACIVVYLFLQTYYTLDTFHAHGARIFMVEHVVTRDGQAQTWGTAPLPLGPALAADLPQVERAVRIDWAGADVRTADRAFTERIAFADTGFFDVFTFPLRIGTPAALTAPGAVILSDAAARKLFGDEDPMGRTLTLAFGDGPAQAFTVGAVAAPFPDNAGFRFDLLLPFAARPAPARPDDWAAITDATFLLVRRPADIEAVAVQMDRYRARRNAAVDDARIERFVFENLIDPAPGAHTVLQRPTEAPHPAFSILMVAIAAFMLALSCFNYINIALGSAARRLREIGVRKVMGGTRRQLVAQFMAENLLLCALALVLGLAVAWAFLIPLFNQVFVLQVALSLVDDLRLWAFLAGLLAFVAVASGAYPAFYVASFQPALILRGKQRLAEKRWFTRSLLTVQFVIAFLAVLLGVVLLMNGRFLVRQAWGYEPDHTLVVRLSDPAQFDLLRDAARQHGAVRAVAGSQHHVGTAWGRTRYSLDDAQEYEAFEYVVGPGYAEAVGLRLHGGRFLDARLAADDGTVVVNRRLAETRGWTDPLDRTLRLDGRTYTVVGVVEDFLYDPIARVQPVLFRRADAGYRFLTVRTAPGSEDAVLAFLEARWQAHVPNLPFEAFAQPEVFDLQYHAYANLARGFSYLAALALLIACLGLFGLASQNSARRLKEVSIRKVLGASVPHIVFLVNRGFLAILAVAALVASALTYGGLRLLLRLDVANVMPITPAPFLIAYLLVLLTVAVSVSTQSRTLATANPADTLRRD